MNQPTKRRTDYLLIGTGVAPLMAAQSLSAKGHAVTILNPDSDFFLENSELPLDLMNFESPTTDISKRFNNNLPEQVYRDLIPVFPGALEMWKEEDDEVEDAKQFKVEAAPWIRYRHRMWVVPAGSPGVDRLESLYLRALDLGWKPKWLEGVSLAKRFPGFSARNLEDRNIDRWVGFMGPRFGDIDVSRYRSGLFEFVREKLGRDNILTSAHVLDIDSKGVRFQLSSGLPINIEVSRAVSFFWTPTMERFLRGQLEKYQPRMLDNFEASVNRQLWEEWNVLSRDPVNPYVVAQIEGLRVWSHGEGIPPVGGWNGIKIMRREQGAKLLAQDSIQDVSRLAFQVLGWDRFTVRSVTPRTFYRWITTAPLEYDSDGLRTFIIRACDGPLHWIAGKIRRAVDLWS
ncbi:MAG: hypothetical protein JST80_09870 [Bdellovibrionales bacterium]|nr:hypothetical protein [Bdellovibrionales bacterium]